MNRIKIFACLVAALAYTSISAYAQSPGPELVERAVTAYNAGDLAYFENHLAEDVVWLDEDGHAMSGKSVVLGFIRNQLNATPSRTLTASNIRVGGTADAAWASFEYMIMAPDVHLMGLNSTVFRKAGDDWEIVLVHGAMNAEAHH